MTGPWSSTRGTLAPGTTRQTPRQPRPARGSGPLLRQGAGARPEERGVWYSKGDVLNRLGRYEDAIRCYDKALKLDPQDARAWYNKA